MRTCSAGPRCSDVRPGGADVSPYAAPARATDLAGLPPTFLASGALDLSLEENLDYSRRLIRAGVPTEVHIYPGAPHGFMMVRRPRACRKQFARDSMTRAEVAADLETIAMEIPPRR